MNNKGFTLVELLAVMVILLAISVVAVTNVTSSLKRNEKQEIEAQKRLAINAAKIYFSLKDKTCVTRNSLVSGKYLDASDVAKLDTYFIIKLDEAEKKYIYDDTNIC